MTGVAPESLGGGSRWLLQVMFRGSWEGPGIASWWGYGITAALFAGLKSVPETGREKARHAASNTNIGPG